MTLTPPSSIAPSSVTIAGTVDVSDRVARLLGHVNVDNFPATQAVSADALPLPTGAAKDSTLTDGTQRVGGTVTTDGSGVTQPISAAALPLPAGAATEATLAALQTAITALDTTLTVEGDSRQAVYDGRVRQSLEALYLLIEERLALA